MIALPRESPACHGLGLPPPFFLCGEGFIWQASADPWPVGDTDNGAPGPGESDVTRTRPGESVVIADQSVCPFTV